MSLICLVACLLSVAGCNKEPAKNAPAVSEATAVDLSPRLPGSVVGIERELKAAGYAATQASGDFGPGVTMLNIASTTVMIQAFEHDGLLRDVDIHILNTGGDIVKANASADAAGCALSAVLLSGDKAKAVADLSRLCTAAQRDTSGTMPTTTTAAATISARSIPNVGCVVHVAPHPTDRIRKHAVAGYAWKK